MSFIKTNNKLLLQILTIVGIFFLVYIGVAFIEGNFNAFKWPEQTRGIFVMVNIMSIGYYWIFRK